MEGLATAFMAAVVGLLWAISSDVKEMKQQLTVEAYERNGLFNKPSKRRNREGAKVAQPLPKVSQGDEGRDRVARVAPRVVKQAMCDRAPHDPDVRRRVANDDKEEPMARLSWNTIDDGGRLKAYARDDRGNEWSIYFMGYSDCVGSHLHGTGEGMVVSLNDEHVASVEMRYHGGELEAKYRFDADAYAWACVGRAMERAEEIAAGLGGGA